MILYVYVHPNASKSEVLGTVTTDAMHYGIPGDRKLEVLKIDLNAAPQDGEANNELIKVLAKHYKISKSSITIVKGFKSKYKTVELVY